MNPADTASTALSRFLTARMLIPALIDARDWQAANDALDRATVDRAIAVAHLRAECDAGLRSVRNAAQMMGVSPERMQLEMWGEVRQ